jgi:threonine/homoserine/homoserine lactone efflux protein
MSMNNPKNIGLRNSILFNFGNYIGHFVVMLACMVFSKILYTVIPQIQFPMKIFGAAYLIYLIIKTLFPSKEYEINKNGNSKNLIVGILLQLVNIKVILFGITAISSYLLPYYKSVPILISFSFLMSSIQFTGNICWTLFGTLMDKIFKKHRMILNIIMAIMLLYYIIKLFI